MSKVDPGLMKFKSLPYAKPKLGKNYWLRENTLPNAMEVVERCLAKPRNLWTFGLPWRPETWPGMRCPGGLLVDELAPIEEWVKRQTGAKRLWQVESPGEASLSHNYVQVVGEGESGPRPHTDSLKLCTYASVLYLTPNAPPEAGTSFYRLRLPGGVLGGNTCPTPYYNLREALGVSGLPLQAWQEDITVPNVFNRMLLYRANLVHSATRYFGTDLPSKRMTIVFFWMAA